VPGRDVPTVWQGRACACAGLRLIAERAGVLTAQRAASGTLCDGAAPCP